MELIEREYEREYAEECIKLINDVTKLVEVHSREIPRNSNITKDDLKVFFVNVKTCYECILKRESSSLGIDDLKDSILFSTFKTYYPMFVNIITTTTDNFELIAKFLNLSNCYTELVNNFPKDEAISIQQETKQYLSGFVATVAYLVFFTTATSKDHAYNVLLNATKTFYSDDETSNNTLMDKVMAILGYFTRRLWDLWAQAHHIESTTTPTLTSFELNKKSVIPIQFMIPIKSMCVLQMYVGTIGGFHLLDIRKYRFGNIEKEVRRRQASVSEDEALKVILDKFMKQAISDEYKKMMLSYQESYQRALATLAPVGADKPIKQRGFLHNSTNPENKNKKKLLPPLIKPPVPKFTQPPVPTIPHLTFTWDFPTEYRCRINLQPTIDKNISIGTLTYSDIDVYYNKPSKFMIYEIVTDNIKYFSRVYNPYLYGTIILSSEALTDNKIILDTEDEKNDFFKYIEDAFNTYMKSRNTNYGSRNSNSGSEEEGKKRGGKPKHIKTTRQNSKGNIIYTKDGKEYVKRLNKKTRKYEFKKTK
jgi:hypothetical protein